MQRRGIWHAALLLVLLLAAASCGLGDSSQSKRRLLGDDRVQAAIVNGTDAPKGRYRYMASLIPSYSDFVFGFHFCGGALIHPRAVLTAGHCVRNQFTGEDYPDYQFKPKVRIGGYNIYDDSASDFVGRSVVRTIVHPFFKTGLIAGTTRDFMTYDAAILVLDKPVTSLPVLQLPTQRTKPSNALPNLTPITTIGWGLLSADGIEADVLQQLNMKLMPLNVCQRDLGSVNYIVNEVKRPVVYNFGANTVICAAKDYPATFSGICSGDSGSPLFKKGADSKGRADVIVGISSFAAARCGQVANKPSAFTDVPQIVGWIRKQLANLDGGSSGSNNRSKVRGASMTSFTGKQTPLAQPAGATLQLLTYPNHVLTAKLIKGATQGSVVIGRVELTGTGTKVAISVANGVLAAVVNGKRLLPGKLAVIRGGRVRHGAALPKSGRHILIEQPGMQIRVSQPYSASRKKLVGQLDVVVVLSSPSLKLGGLLGRTLPTQSSAGGMAATAGPLAAAISSGVVS